MPGNRRGRGWVPCLVSEMAVGPMSGIWAGGEGVPKFYCIMSNGHIGTRLSPEQNDRHL